MKEDRSEPTEPREPRIHQHVRVRLRPALDSGQLDRVVAAFAPHMPRAQDDDRLGDEASADRDGSSTDKSI